MTQPRKNLIDLSITPYYHCISSCVRQSYLCGHDKNSKTNYEHRRHWIDKRIKFLASHFAIHICAFAIMQNHYHLVLMVNSELAKSFTETQVVQRWSAIYSSAQPLVNSYLDGKGTLAEKIQAKKIIQQWRKNLYSISWFMRNINQYIALKANKEDNCKGHFWASRYKSQALIDDAAVFACMVYVDLNPVRAGLAKNLNDSHYTSIRERIKSLADALNKPDKSEKTNHYQPTSLLPFKCTLFTCKEPRTTGNLNFSLIDYLILVDKTGRCIRQDKRGYIDSHTESVLNRLKLSSQTWLDITQEFERKFGAFAGLARNLETLAHQQNRRRRFRGATA